MRRLTHALAAAALALTGTLLLSPAQAAPTAAGGNNDPGCTSTAHPNPVVILHGLGATYYEDTNLIQIYLATRGYCTFSETYGSPTFDGHVFPYVGGLQPIADSAAQIKAFILQVLAETGASKVDIVGHSEGGFQSLYVTKTQGIAEKIAHVVSIAPPTHGTTFGGLVNLAYAFGIRAQVGEALEKYGCPACDNLITDGSAIATLNNGPIAQPGVAYTVIASRYDELVTPTSTAFVNEPGVKNVYVQDLCPLDPVGHLNEAYDLNVWKMITNALDPANAKSFVCSAGLPG